MEKGRCACLAGICAVKATVLVCLSMNACFSLYDTAPAKQEETKQGRSIAGFMSVYTEDYGCDQDAFTAFSGLPGAPLPEGDRAAEEPITVCDGCEDVYLIKSDHIWGENHSGCASLLCPAYGNDEDHFWFYIAFASEFIDVTTYHDAMLCSYYSWPGGGNAWYLMAADETEETLLHREGDDIIWSQNSSGASKGWTQGMSEPCGFEGMYSAAPSEAAARTFRAGGTIPCPEYSPTVAFEAKEDVWEFLATPGETVTITIDTPSAETTFHPDGLLFGQESCEVGVLYDTVECSASIDWDAGCPSTTFVAEESSYRLILEAGGVHGGYDCVSETAEYSIYLDALTEPGLSLVYDDIPAHEPSRSPSSFSFSGFARITR